MSKCSEKLVAIEQDTRHSGDICARFMEKAATYTELPKKLHGTDRKRPISKEKELK